MSAQKTRHDKTRQDMITRDERLGQAPLRERKRGESESISEVRPALGVVVCRVACLWVKRQSVKKQQKRRE